MNSDHLFKQSVSDRSDEERRCIIDIYKMLVEMADRVSQRRQNANNFYLSVNSAIIAALSYIQVIGGASISAAIISSAGIAISLLWIRNIQSYRDLNNGKFHVITEIEKKLPVSPFTAEWSYLERGHSNARYRPFHSIEILVPIVFVALHVVQIFRVFPWSLIKGYLFSLCWLP